MSRNYNPRRAGTQKSETPQTKIINSMDEIPQNMSDKEAAEFWSTHSMSEELLEKQIIEDEPKQVKPEDVVWQPGTDNPTPITEADKIAHYSGPKRMTREEFEQDEKDLAERVARGDFNEVAKKIVEKEKAVYHVERTQSGVNLTHVDKKEQQYVDAKNKKLNGLNDLIENTQKEILRIELEIEIHTILEKESKSEQEQNMNLRRLESFRTNLEYLQKKLNVALNMTK